MDMWRMFSIDQAIVLPVGRRPREPGKLREAWMLRQRWNQEFLKPWSGWGSMEWSRLMPRIRYISLIKRQLKLARFDKDGPRLTWTWLSRYWVVNTWMVARRSSV